MPMSYARQAAQPFFIVRSVSEDIVRQSMGDSAAIRWDQLVRNHRDSDILR